MYYEFSDSLPIAFQLNTIVTGNDTRHDAGLLNVSGLVFED